MKQLSSSTLDAIASLICGDEDIKDEDGDPIYTYYRPASKVKLLFGDVGLLFPKENNLTWESRHQIALGALRHLNEPGNQTRLEKLLFLLASPSQYQLSTKSWKKSVEVLNKILAPEGYRIDFPEGGIIPIFIPVIPYVIEDTVKIQKTPYPKPDFSKLADDKQYVENLNKRWDEIIRCINNHAYLSSIVMMGGVLEGILLSIAKEHIKDFNTAAIAPRYQGDSSGKIKELKDWRLNDFINVAHELGWISKSTKDFNDKLRNYRNFIHPLKNIQQGEYPDVGLANICLTVVDVTINEIITHK